MAQRGGQALYPSLPHADTQPSLGLHVWCKDLLVDCDRNCRETSNPQTWIVHKQGCSGHDWRIRRAFPSPGLQYFSWTHQLPECPCFTLRLDSKFSEAGPLHRSLESWRICQGITVTVPFLSLVCVLQGHWLKVAASQNTWAPPNHCMKDRGPTHVNYDMTEKLTFIL